MMTEEFKSSIDLAVSWILDALAGFHRKRLYADTDVIAVSRGHPVGAKLSRLDAFLDAEASGAGRRPEALDLVLRQCPTALAIVRAIVLRSAGTSPEPSAEEKVALQEQASEPGCHRH